MQCHEQAEPPAGVEVAECFTVDFCEHGHGTIALFRKGEAEPFAVAWFGPSAVLDMARVFADAVQVEGHA